MEINYLTVLGAGVIAMILGSLWYSPILFGKKWMKLNGVTEADLADPVKCKELQKDMIPTMLIQFVMVLLLAYILTHFIKAWTGSSGIETALWIWLGFIVPTLASSVLWTNETRSIKVSRFLIQAVYNLVLLIIFGYVLQTWG